MPQPTITSAVFLGNSAQPNGQGVMPWANLADLASWFPDDYSIDGANRQIGIAPLPFRGRGAYVSDDFGSKSIIIPSKYFEGPGVALGAAKAQLSQAGEQYLTLDGKVTGALVKLKSFGTPKRLRKFSPFWWDLPQLEFVMKEPFFQDLLPTGSLNGELIQTGFEVAGTTAVLSRSLGTEAGTDNSITYWAIQGGVPTYAAHVVTMPANAFMTKGHMDTWDGIYQVRSNWVTGASAHAYLHFTDATHYLRLVADGATLKIRALNGAVATDYGSVACALTNGNVYWLKIQGSGTTYTATVFNDSAGAVGSQVATTGPVTIPDGVLQAGQYGIGALGATLSFGGAFASVSTFTGPVPVYGSTNWTCVTIAGEPDFCWSKNSPYSGKFSPSISNLAAGGQGRWTLAGLTYASQLLTLSGRLRGSGTPTTFRLQTLDGLIFTTIGPTDGVTWALKSASGTPAANQSLALMGFGAGTFYFDDLVLSPLVSSVAGVPYYLQPAVEQVALAGSVSPGTATSWVYAYAGSVRANPLFQLNIPNTNTVVINQLILANTMSGETLTITFGPPLAANTAWTITIDTAAFTCTDNLGNSHDITGSFPMLYGPAGQSNPFTATLITASGTSTGVTLDSKWFARYEC